MDERSGLGVHRQTHLMRPPCALRCTVLTEGCCKCRSPGAVACARHWPGGKAHHPVLPRRGPNRAVACSRCPSCVSEVHASSWVLMWQWHC